MEADTFNTLMNRAGKLLSRRPYSSGELRAKMSAFADSALLDQLIARLEKLNLLNDRDYAYNFALCRMIQEGWGPLRVLHSLLRQQVAPDVAHAAIERIRQEHDEQQLLGEYLARHCRKGGVPKDRKGIQKLVSHLQRRGFLEAAIFSALRQRIPAAAWQQFDTGE